MSKLKAVAKKIIPKKMISFLNSARSNINNHNIFNYDKKRFKKNYSKNNKSWNVAQTNAKLIFFAHSIEKGLSHDELRLGFGKNALEGLSDAMSKYETNNFDKSNMAYQNALSVLNEYIKIHEQNNYNLKYIEKIFNARVLDEARKCNQTIGGADKINKNNLRTDFKDLFTNRYSVRTYSTKRVDVNKINNAIQISTKSPSVCNRQSSRVYVISNKKIIEKVLKIQGGMNGYQTPPILIITTSDINCFVSLSERNQPYIDGGAFSMSLLLSLEYEGLAACPLNAMFNKKQTESIRDIVGIKGSENIIMLISVGNFKEYNNVAKSFRYDAAYITRYVK